MGVITNLIGMNQAAKKADLDRQIGMYEAVLRLPDEQVRPGVKQSAIQNLIGLTTKEGGEAGKKHAGFLGGMLSVLAGMNPMPRAQRPPVAMSSSQILASPEEREQFRTQQAEGEARRELAQGEIVRTNRRKLGETKGFQGEALTQFELTGKLPTGYAAEDLPGERETVALKSPSTGKIYRVKQNAKGRYFNVLGRDVTEELPQDVEPADEASKTRGAAFEQLKEAHRIKNDPNADPAEKAAAEDYIEKYDVADIKRKEIKAEAASIFAGIKAGKTDPAMTGLGRVGLKGAVEAMAAEEGYDLKQAQMDQHATRRWVAGMNAPGQLRLRQATDFAAESLDLLDNPKAPGDDLIGQLRKSVPTGQYPVLNKKALEAARNGLFGDQAASDATQLQSQIREMQSELAVVYKGGNSPTDQGIKNAEDLLKGEWSEKVLRDAIRLSRKNLGIRLNSIKRTLPAGLSEEGMGRFQGGGGGGAGAGGRGEGGGGAQSDPLGILK